MKRYSKKRIFPPNAWSIDILNGNKKMSLIDRLKKIAQLADMDAKNWSTKCH